MERRIALVENVAIANHAMSHIREGLQNVSNDSDVHPIQYGGLNLCAIAESLLKNLSPLQQLTKDEITAIRAKIENPDGEIVLGRGQRKKTLKSLGNAIVGFISENCWCIAFQRT